jgi:Transposase
MAMFVGLDVSLKTTSVCVVEADGSLVWEEKVESEPTSLVKSLMRWRDLITLVGIEACPLSEWLYGACVESGFQTVCIETRRAQRFLSSRPNKTDRSDARGIADMMRLGHSRPVHVKSKAFAASVTASYVRRTDAQRARHPRHVPTLPMQAHLQRFLPKPHSPNRHDQDPTLLFMHSSYFWLHCMSQAMRAGQPWPTDCWGMKVTARKAHAVAARMSLQDMVTFSEIARTKLTSVVF